MGLVDVVEATQEARGIKCYELGILRDEYLETHTELARERLSKGLFEGIRQELAGLGAIVWPKELVNHEQERTVYVILRAGKVGQTLMILNREPEAFGAGILSDFLDEPWPREPRT